MADDQDKCPCGSGETYARCCGPFLAGAPAPSAEALMRSRYTAYVRGDVDYVIASHDPATREDVDRDETESWSRRHRWLGLEIVARDQGGEADERGVVEFVARFADDQGEYAHHERSTFRKVDGRWFFVDGQIVKAQPKVRAEPKTGRNDPCPCGSGKKYKRCHGAAA